MTTNAVHLRHVADLLDKVGDRLPFQPYLTSRHDGITLYWFVQTEYEDEAEQKQAVHALVRLLGGKWDKGGHGDTFRLQQDRDGIRMIVTASREAVCERVATGTRQVTVSAVEADSGQSDRPDGPVRPPERRTGHHLPWGNILAPWPRRSSPGRPHGGF